MIYCVESRHQGPGLFKRAWLRFRGRPVPQGGTFRFWTASQARAQQVASDAPGRRVLELHLEQAPPEVRANLQRANPHLA